MVIESVLLLEGRIPSIETARLGIESLSCPKNFSQLEEWFTIGRNRSEKEKGKKLNIPKAPARRTQDQAIAMSPPGGRCAAVPRGGGGPVVDDISGSGSSVLAVGGRVFDDRGRTRGRRVTTRRGATGAEEAEHYCISRCCCCCEVKRIAKA